MNKSFILNEEESNRILSLHKTAINKEFLHEQEQVTTPVVTSTTTLPPTSTPPVQKKSQTDNIIEIQTLLGVKADGKFGPKTLSALQSKLGSTTTNSSTTTTTTTPATGTPATGTPATGTPSTPEVSLNSIYN